MLTFEEINNITRGFREARIILTAVELDVFTCIDNKELTAEDIASALRTDPDGTSILLDALVSLEILRKSNDCYSNSEAAQRYLSKNSKNYRGATFHHQNGLWARWSDLTEIVRNGRRDLPQRSEEQRRQFILAMHHGKTPQAMQLPPSIDFANVRKALDLGGGPGSYSIAMAEKHPALHVVLFDFPHALSVARTVIPQHLLDERITLLEGDFLDDPIGEDYDLVLASSIIHIFGPDKNRKLLKKCFRSLNPGGRILVRDSIVSEDGTRPRSAALFAVNMLVNTLEGRSYKESDIRGWLTEAGFKDVERIVTESESHIILGKKPE